MKAQTQRERETQVPENSSYARVETGTHFFYSFLCCWVSAEDLSRECIMRKCKAHYIVTATINLLCT